MGTDRFKQLLEKRYSSTLSKDESEEFFYLLTTLPQDVVSQLIDQFIEVDMQHPFNKWGVYDKINKEIGDEQNVPPKRSVFYKYVAIAATLLLFSTFGFFIYQRVHSIDSNKTLTLEKLLDEFPGGEYATITLPNGLEVNLDSIEFSQSLQVGSFIVKKNEFGEISYENTQTDLNVNPVYTLKTPKSSTADLVLSDGTKVLLNGGSTLRYPMRFEEGDRIVELEGEGYFQVNKTVAKNRFIVKSKDQITEVLGTKFNVKSYTDDHSSWVTLEEGSVNVSPVHKEYSAIKLVPNQQAIIRSEKLSVKDVDLESVLGWTNGVFYFNGTNTIDVLKEIERWYDIDITYASNGKNLQYTGKIPRKISLNKLIDLLSYADLTVQPKLNKENKINLIIN